MARANVESIDRSSDCDVAGVSRGGARARKRGNAFSHTRVFCSDTWHGMGGVPLVCLRFV